MFFDKDRTNTTTLELLAQTFPSAGEHRELPNAGLFANCWTNQQLSRLYRAHAHEVRFVACRPEILGCNKLQQTIKENLLQIVTKTHQKKNYKSKKKVHDPSGVPVEFRVEPHFRFTHLGPWRGQGKAQIRWAQTPQINPWTPTSHGHLPNGGMGQEPYRAYWGHIVSYNK